MQNTLGFHAWRDDGESEDWGGQLGNVEKCAGEAAAVVDNPCRRQSLFMYTMRDVVARERKYFEKWTLVMWKFELKKRLGYLIRGVFCQVTYKKTKAQAQASLYYFRKKYCIYLCCIELLWYSVISSQYSPCSFNDTGSFQIKYVCV